MAVCKDRMQLINAFRDGKIDRFSIFVEGLGEFFVSRSMDGFVFGSTDKKMKEGKDDHSTALLDELGELRGFHRKVSDDSAYVYMKYDINYILSPDGIKELLQDMSRKGGTPFPAKVMLILFYKALRSVFERTWDNDARVLETSEARRFGLKPPCIYVKPKDSDKRVLRLLRHLFIAQNRMQNRIHAKPTDRFRERHFVGEIVTKHPKKKEN